MNEQTFWYRIINYWCELEGHYGLTIPFLIGASRVIGEKDYDIQRLLTEIKKSNVEHRIIISYCSDLDEYILGTFKSEYPNINSLTSFESLLINDNTLEAFKSFDELVNFFSSKHSESISKNCFSKNMDKGVWEKFHKDDVQIIEQAIDIQRQ